MYSMRAGLTVAGVVIVLGAAVSAADWPQWQGPDRTRSSKETGLLKEWPAGGPPVVWTATGLGSGYGSMAIYLRMKNVVPPSTAARQKGKGKQ